MALATAMAIAGCGSSEGGDTNGSPGTGAGTGGAVGTGSGAAMGTGGDGAGMGTGGGGAGMGTGGGSATPGEGAVTTLGGAQVLNALTPAEASQLCSDTYAYFRSTIDRAVFCKSTGLGFAISSSAPTDEVMRENCGTYETDCLQEAPESPTCNEIPPGCTATVEQYSACITDQATDFVQGVNGLTGCATLASSDKPAVWEFVTRDLPASCTALTSTCAGLNPPPPS